MVVLYYKVLSWDIGSVTKATEIIINGICSFAGIEPASY